MLATPAPISLVIPCYNAEQYIQAALQSVVGQTLPVSEVVIVNDGSTDDTLSVIEAFSRQHPGLIRVITQQNQGPAAARTNAVRAALHNDVITFDADDWLHPEAVEAWYAHASRNPHFALVYGSYYTMNADGLVTGKVTLHEYRTDPLEGAILPTMLWENVVSATCFVRRDKVLEVGGYYDEYAQSLRLGGEDVLCYFRLLLAGYEFGYVPRTLFYYRDHAQEISKNAGRGAAALKMIHEMFFRTEPEKMANAFAVVRKWREDEVRLGQAALRGRNQTIATQQEQLLEMQQNLERLNTEIEQARAFQEMQNRELLIAREHQERLYADIEQARAFQEMQNRELAIAREHQERLYADIEQARTFQDNMQRELDLQTQYIRSLEASKSPTTRSASKRSETKT